MRSALIMQGLESRGHETSWVDEQEIDSIGDSADCIVLQKRYDEGAVRLVERRRARGRRVVLDLWDNHFIVRPGNAEQQHEADLLRHMLTRVDAITACSPALASIVRQECPDAAPVHVIGDRIDDLSMVPSSLPERFQAWLSQRRACQRQRSERVGLIWFGDKGTKRTKVGLPDIASLIPDLEALNEEFPLRLTIVSNSRKRYRRLFAAARFPHHYEPWLAASFPTLLSTHQIALIPASNNEFTRCKSDNRAVSALTAGLAVVASDVPSYRRYAKCMLLGDIAPNLRRYLESPALREAHAHNGGLLALQSSKPDTVIDAWEQALAA